jgi:hypothetical protein
MVEFTPVLAWGQGIREPLKFGQIQPESIRLLELWLVQGNAASAGSEDQPVSPNWRGERYASFGPASMFFIDFGVGGIEGSSG